MYISTGTLRYYDTGWLIVHCCDELARYYRRSLRKKCLSSVAAGSHITVINGYFEQAQQHPAWRKHDGLEIEFNYCGEVLNQDNYYWITTVCPQLHQIREELGLPQQLKWPLHLTVAKQL